MYTYIYGESLYIQYIYIYIRGKVLRILRGGGQLYTNYVRYNIIHFFSFNVYVETGSTQKRFFFFRSSFCIRLEGARFHIRLTTTPLRGVTVTFCLFKLSLLWSFGATHSERGNTYYTVESFSNTHHIRMRPVCTERER